jgi:hypothetical protein
VLSVSFTSSFDFCVFPFEVDPLQMPVWGEVEVESPLDLVGPCGTRSSLQVPQTAIRRFPRPEGPSGMVLKVSPANYLVAFWG